MSEYSKFNIVYRLQKWMDSVPGQTFLNYAYSWGASVVILGTLFKLTHLPGANLMLFLGMGTEVFVFFLSAFDRPFDKTADGMDIPTHVTEEYLDGGMVQYGNATPSSPLQQTEGSQTVAQPIQFVQTGQTVKASQTVQAEQPIVGEEPIETRQPSQTGPIVAQPAQAVWAEGQQQVTAEMAEAQDNYVEELKKLVETLEKVNEQSSRLTRDSEEMENLNRTLTGISKVYEMQLKGASQQIGTIDQINEQSRKMAQQIEQLNKIYTRMIEAMTVNMRAAATGVKSEE